MANSMIYISRITYLCISRCTTYTDYLYCANHTTLQWSVVTYCNNNCIFKNFKNDKWYKCEKQSFWLLWMFQNMVWSFRGIINIILNVPDIKLHCKLFAQLLLDVYYSFTYITESRMPFRLICVYIKSFSSVILVFYTIDIY